MDTKVQQYLLDHSLEQLHDEHGVKARLAGHKVSLNYDQIEADERDPIAKECRGLILACENGKHISLDEPLGRTIVLARPFSRFFNLGQDCADEVDLWHEGTRIFEKMDGTLTIVYYDHFLAEWCVATRSVPNADIGLDGYEGYTFRVLFERACEYMGFTFAELTSKLYPDRSYMFELMTPLNQIVVRHDSYRIVLLGVRDNRLGTEFDPVEEAKVIGVPHAPVYRFNSISEMLRFVEERDANKHEGVVVCDLHYRRVKIKSEAYVAAARVRDSAGSSPRNLLTLILLEQIDDALPLLPDDLVERTQEMVRGLREFMREFKRKFDICMAAVKSECPGDDDRLRRKVFALAAQKEGLWMAPAMAIYQGQVPGLHEWIMSKRNDQGGWPNSVLDQLLKAIRMKV